MTLQDFLSTAPQHLIDDFFSDYEGLRGNTETREQFWEVHGEYWELMLREYLYYQDASPEELDEDDIEITLLHEEGMLDEMNQ